MKNLLLLFRHWLIRKLGGYTEQKIVQYDRRPPEASTLLHPERVVANMRVNYREVEMLSGSMDREKFLSDRLRSCLVEKAVNEIIKSGYAVLACEPDHLNWPEERIYSLAICIVHPNEWMKTSLGNIMDPAVLRKER